MENRLDCRKCMHFYITWDDSYPFGCRAFGIKSRQIPSMVVSLHSGYRCRMFKNKNSFHTEAKHG